MAGDAIHCCKMEQRKEKQRNRSGWRPLLLAIGCFLVLGTLYIWNAPPFEGPDEPQHFAYVRRLAEGDGFPPQGEAAWETPIEQEASQPPLYYLLASLPARFIDLDDPPAAYRPNPHFVAPLERTVWDNDNRAIHYPDDATPLRGGWLALYLSRGIALAFGVLLVVAVYGLAREVVPAKPTVAWAAALLIATIPQVLFIGAVVSNDIPAAALSTLTLWMLARLLRRGPSRGRTVALGLAFGLAILTKASTFVLALPVALGIGWLWLSGRQAFWTTSRTAVESGLGAFIVGGWWYIRSWLLYGSPLGLETHDAALWAISDPATIDTLRNRWLEVVRSFWIAFGWGTIRPRGWVYTVIFCAMLIAAIGLIVAVWRWWQRPGRRPDTGAILSFLLALSVLAVVFMLEVWMHRVKASHGRLLFPAAGALVILLVLGWHTLHPRLPFVAIILTGGLALLAPFLLLRPAYTPPPLLSAAEVSALPESLGIRFGRTAEQPLVELVSVTPDRDEIGAGSVLPVHVCWRVLAETETDFSVLLQVLGPGNHLIATRRSYPGMGLYPSSQWQPGQAFCDQMHIQIDASRVYQTLRYLIEVAIIDNSSEERLQVFAGDGQRLDVAFVDDVVVRTQSESWSAPEGAEPLQLLDYDLSESWEPGEAATVRLKWGVAAPVEKDYQVFVHLRDPASGANVAQADGPPLGGWYPTSSWIGGEIVSEERTILLPEEIPPGSYRLFAGFYALESGRRFGPENDLGLITVGP